jgi:hypothetical protein
VFDYNELVAAQVPQTLSAKDQILSVQSLTYLSLCDHKEIMACKSSENVQALKERYPEDNDVENPGSCFLYIALITVTFFGTSLHYPYGPFAYLNNIF